MRKWREGQGKLGGEAPMGVMQGAVVSGQPRICIILNVSA